MRRPGAEDAMREIARAQGATASFRRRGRHTKVYFDERPVTLYRTRVRLRVARRFPLPRSATPERHAVTVESRHPGGGWAIEFPAHRDAHSHAYRLAQVPELAADALALWLEQQVERDDLDVVHRLGSLGPLVDEALETRRASEAVRAEASAALRRAVLAGVEQGLSTRDIGFLLDMTHQRVSELARELGVSARARASDDAVREAEEE